MNLFNPLYWWAPWLKLMQPPENLASQPAVAIFFVVITDRQNGG